TEVPPAVPRTTGPRTRSHFSVAATKSLGTRRKSLAPRKMPSSEVDLNAPDKSFLHVLSDDDSARDTNPHYEHAFAAWEIVPTGLDLHVLFDSTPGGLSVGVWDDQQEWVIYRWKLFPFSGVHVLETFAGKILYMFTDTPYPLSASLMKKMLKHKLEVEVDGVGNDMTHAVQLIQFIKNRLASCVPSD
ncbi:hypothetical protein Tco_1065487, partial [Tanacetum coccineum]